MIFLISRASDALGEKKPCDAAYKDTENRWVINIARLDDLLAFSASERVCLIVSGIEVYNPATGRRWDIPEIVIYDANVE